MRNRVKLFSFSVITILIFNLTFTHSLHAHSITSDMIYADIVPNTKVNNLADLKNTLQIAANNLQSEITLIVPNADMSTYSNIVYKITGISSYQLSLSKNGSSNKLVISLKYKQAYRLTQALKNTTAYNRLTSSDLALLDRAQSIIVQIISPEMSDYEKELAIHDYIVTTTSYDYDRLHNDTIPDSSYTAAGVLINKVAVCEGYSEATKLLLNLIGIECEIVTGFAGNNTAHAWNIVKIDGEWYMLDTTYDDPVSFNNGKRIETLSYDYFNVTSATLKKDHSWDSSMWPNATATTYNYFNVSSKIVNNYNEFKTYVIGQIKSGQKEILCYVNNYNSSTFNLNFIFDYHSGGIQYSTPISTNGSFKISLQ